MTPKLVHYNFGFDPTFSYKPLSEYHYLNILSLKKTNPDFEILFHYHYEPSGTWWDKIKKIVKLLKIENISSYDKFKFIEHKSDIFRLETLIKYGGIHLDIDVVCIKKLDGFLHTNFLMGKEVVNGTVKGLCNAVMFSEKNSEFARIWLEKYNSDYTDAWSVNGVIQPYSLSILYPHLITVVSEDYFFKYSWTEECRKKIFFEEHDFSDCYCLHQWATKNNDLLEKITYDRVLEEKNTLFNIYKSVL